MMVILCKIVLFDIEVMICFKVYKSNSFFGDFYAIDIFPNWDFKNIYLLYMGYKDLIMWVFFNIDIELNIFL